MKKFVLIFLVALTNLSIAQLPIGGWRDHFSFVDIFSIVEMSDGTILGASESGIFYLNVDGSIDKLTKASGLSDVGLAAMEYFQDFDAIVLGYENGNIDIVVGGDVYNVSDIKRKNIAGNKQIYSITSQGNYAFLSCGFGIVKLDVENFEISDTFYIGEEASFVEVYKTVSFEDSIYAATNQGLFVANKNDFLADYNNWDLTGNSDSSIFYDITVFNNVFYAVVKFEGESTQLIKKQNNSWQIVNPDILDESSLYFYDNLYIATGKSILVYNSADVLTEKIEHYVFDWSIDPQFVAVSKDGRLLIGDKHDGLVIHTNTADDFFSPVGVYQNEVINVKAYDGYVYATRGGFKDNGVNLWLNAKVSYFVDNEWNLVEQSGANDFYSILVDDSDFSHYYIGAWGYGIYEYQGDELLNHYDASNSPLQSIIEGAYTRISGMDYDNQKNIWIVNRSENNALNVLKTDNTWKSFVLNHTISNINTGQLSVLKSGIVWIELPDDGFFALDYNNTIDNEDDDIYKLFYPIDENGEGIGAKILCFQEDLDGDVWFGTDEGVGVYYNPTNFNEENFVATKIKITASLNDSLVTDYLLKGEKVLSIAVDGGNRKWLGTGNSGVYLMNETGTKELLHFDTENSPLPSNKVVSISIEPSTGEVFFATTKGLVSYRGDAIVANNQYEDVYVFPNPIRPDYYENITITGLILDSNVKITDITGNIVYETTSNGGQATWDGNDFSGNRVHTGVYLVFCSNNEGTETFVTKLLFIN